MEEVLSLQNIVKSYSGSVVLKGVDFSLNEGEIHCIVGENGAGKSTIIKILSGAIPFDSGKIVLYNKEYHYDNPQLPLKMGISTIYQDVDLVDTLTVADNIFLGGEIGKAGFINIKKQTEQAKALLDSLKIKMDPSVLVEALSPAQVQMLQMVKALHRDAKILIMDEPTASLGEEETKALMKTVKDLSKKGISIIYISHYLEEVFEIADRITVLKDGVVTGCYNAKEVSSNDIITAMVGRQASLSYKRERISVGNEFLEIRDFSRRSVVKNINLTLNKGEILGIGGLVGSGRTEFVRLICGADRRNSGRMFKNGKEIFVNSPSSAIKNGICMLGENRKVDSMFLVRSIAENMCLVRNEKKVTVSPANDKYSSNDLKDKLNIKMLTPDQEIMSLSGGNQQKTLLARWLLTECDIIIFDEPTKGIDIGAREEIYKNMVELARSGKSIIMVSSDMAELLSMSDRIAVLREGEMVALLPTKDLTEQKLLEIYFGVNVK
jgi:ribose transport system ATP-binding protein